MDTLVIDAPLWLRIAIYLWLVGKAVAFLRSCEVKNRVRSKDG